jgi:hypothetical protein
LTRWSRGVRVTGVTLNREEEMNRSTEIYEPSFKCKDLNGWKRGLRNNTDPYGRRCYTYAEDWAKLMETEMAGGPAVADCAEATSHEADTDGITGFMYGAAVSILSNCWEHGEELRKWHNLDMQIGNEGAKANESGGVLNPALLSIGSK